MAKEFSVNFHRRRVLAEGSDYELFSFNGENFSSLSIHLKYPDKIRNMVSIKSSNPKYDNWGLWIPFVHLTQ